MNFIQDLIVNFQNLVAQVPDLVQPLILMLAGAVPFIEGEGAAAIGIIGGINPIVAGVAGAIGNFLCVLVVVWVTSGARGAVVNRSRAKSPVAAEGFAMDAATGADGAADAAGFDAVDNKPESKGRKRFKTWVNRFGVPGASLLGPLAIPTQFTSALLVAAGTSKSWVLLWQAIAIVMWTTIVTVGMWLLLHFGIGA